MSKAKNNFRASLEPRTTQIIENIAHPGARAFAVRLVDAFTQAYERGGLSACDALMNQVDGMTAKLAKGAA
jgi:hypothetical protein